MAAFPRTELDEMVRRWLKGNEQCEQTGDWRSLAEMYTEDANYGWNAGPDQEFMAVGRDEIRDIALGQEMQGLEHWSYPYQKFVIDDQNGEVIGLWKQIADATRPDGTAYEVAGIGGSWFRYGGNYQWCWQRDFFDFGNMSALFMELMRDKALSDGMQQRIDRAMSGQRQPGYFRRGKSPVPIW
ncbi:MAG TPA: nuclear transport factor 2 family protein [Pseudonocardiaceae bacterium]|jgi:hypothetical protein|nr:nuclear transport factor 2 family protein [Pseudonocardiaceae bacterium]